MLDPGFWFLVAGSWLLVAGYWSLEKNGSGHKAYGPRPRTKIRSFHYSNPKSKIRNPLPGIEHPASSDQQQVTRDQRPEARSQ
jgi:hypothetical protein